MKDFAKSGDLKKVSGLIGKMVLVSRLFSQFYFRCRVLPGLVLKIFQIFFLKIFFQFFSKLDKKGCSGFDGSFEVKLDADLRLTKSRIFTTKLFVTRFDVCFEALRIKPLSTM